VGEARTGTKRARCEAATQPAGFLCLRPALRPTYCWARPYRFRWESYPLTTRAGPSRLYLRASDPYNFLGRASLLLSFRRGHSSVLDGGGASGYDGAVARGRHHRGLLTHLLYYPYLNILTPRSGLRPISLGPRYRFPLPAALALPDGRSSLRYNPACRAVSPVTTGAALFFPLFSGVRGRGILRTSPRGGSRKLCHPAYIRIASPPRY